VWAPEGAADGKAKVTLSFPAWKAGNVAPATFTVSVVPPKAEGKDDEKRKGVQVDPSGR
jgi:hypothetical protein